MKFNIRDIDKAVDEAAISASIKTAEKRDKALGKSFFSEIIKELRATGADKAAVDNLEKELDISTNRNQTLLGVIRKGGEIAERILELIK